MENNNILTDEERNKINKFLNSDYNETDVKFESEKNNDVVEFSVMTDGYHFFVSCADIGKICTQISAVQLEAIGVNFETRVVSEKNCVIVNEDFLIYVQKNTKKPRYVPVLCLLKSLYVEAEQSTKTNNIM